MNYHQIANQLDGLARDMSDMEVSAEDAAVLRKAAGILRSYDHATSIPLHSAEMSATHS